MLKTHIPNLNQFEMRLRLISRNLNFLNISPVYETVYINKQQSSYIFINKELKKGNIINTKHDMFMENTSQLTYKIKSLY